MNIGITGASGFVGRHLAAAAIAANHSIVGFSRNPRPLAPFAEMRPWQPHQSIDLSGLDAIIHLAGESLMGVWSASRKHNILHSRISDTAALARAIHLHGGPSVLVSASGSGFYGDQGDSLLPESAPHGQGFLAEVCMGWESAAAQAAPVARTVSLRSGMVLGPDGGAAPILASIFRLALGGRLGHGRQWSPWIHIDDLTRLFLFAAENPALHGPVNAAAPGAVTNAQFTAALAAAVHRPAIFPVPAFALRLLPGGMSEMFLHSQRLIPEAALNAGFRFLHPELPEAFSSILAH
jgi:uncharacterized protein